MGGTNMLQLVTLIKFITEFIKVWQNFEGRGWVHTKLFCQLLDVYEIKTVIWTKMSVANTLKPMPNSLRIKLLVKSWKSINIPFFYDITQCSLVYRYISPRTDQITADLINGWERRRTLCCKTHTLSLRYTKHSQCHNWQYLRCDRWFLYYFGVAWQCMESFTAPIYNKKFNAKRKAHAPTGIDF